MPKKNYKKNKIHLYNYYKNIKFSTFIFININSKYSQIIKKYQKKQQKLYNINTKN